MSYKIRYGYDRYRQIPEKHIFWVQSLVSGVLLLMAGMVRLWDGGIRMLGLVLSSGPMTVSERAVSALSGALAGGEGWYQALAVWCRTLIDAGTV